MWKRRLRNLEDLIQSDLHFNHFKWSWYTKRELDATEMQRPVIWERLAVLHEGPPRPAQPVSFVATRTSGHVNWGCWGDGLYRGVSLLSPCTSVGKHGLAGITSSPWNKEYSVKLTQHGKFILAHLNLWRMQRFISSLLKHPNWSFIPRSEYWKSCPQTLFHVKRSPFFSGITYPLSPFSALGIVWENRDIPCHLALCV